MDLHVGDVVVLKKPHPCWETRFELMRVGMDVRLKCTGCGREVLVPRKKAEKSIRTVEALAGQEAAEREAEHV